MKTSKTQAIRIDGEAAAALIEWKSMFAQAVVEGAQRRAAMSKSSDSVTLADYRHAAREAMLKLADAIESGADGQQKAA